MCCNAARMCFVSVRCKLVRKLFFSGAGQFGWTDGCVRSCGTTHTADCAARWLAKLALLISTRGLEMSEVAGQHQGARPQEASIAICCASGRESERAGSGRNVQRRDVGY